MIMRYFGGGIGHLNNTPPRQAHRSGPLNPNFDQMAVDEDEEDDSGCDATDEPQDVVMNNGELEVGENDEEDESEDDSDVEDSDNYDYEEDDMEGVEYGDDFDEGNEGGSGGSDEESARGSDDEEDGYGYASP